MIQQVQNLANWVMKFDPLDFVRNAENVQLDESNDHVFKDFTD